MAMIVFPQFSKADAMISLPGSILYSFPASSLEMMWFNPLPGSKMGSCSRHQSPGLSPQASQGQFCGWLTPSWEWMEDMKCHEMWKFTFLPYKPCGFAWCCMIFRFVLCVCRMELCFQSPTVRSILVASRIGGVYGTRKGQVVWDSRFWKEY